MKVTVILIVSRKLGMVHEDWEKGLEDHLKYSIGEIDQNSERSPGDKRTLIFAQTPVKNYEPETQIKKSLKTGQNDKTKERRWKMKRQKEKVNTGENNHTI